MENQRINGKMMIMIHVQFDHHHLPNILNNLKIHERKYNQFNVDQLVFLFEQQNPHNLDWHDNNQLRKIYLIYLIEVLLLKYHSIDYRIIHQRDSRQYFQWIELPVHELVAPVVLDDQNLPKHVRWHLIRMVLYYSHQCLLNKCNKIFRVMEASSFWRIKSVFFS